MEKAFWLRDEEDESDSERIVGQLTEFVHKREADERALNLFEKAPRFQIVACYMRNREYNPDVVRTPATLARCCDYLLKTVLPLADDPQVNQLDVLEFVQNRLRAIRCEYHVQSKFDASVYYSLVRFQVYLLSIVSDTSELRTTMDSYLNSSFEQLLKRPLLVLCILLLETSTGGYLKTLARFSEEQLQRKEVRRSIAIANSVVLGDFRSYFKYLQEADFFEANLLYIFADRMRTLGVRIFAKTQLNLPLEYLRDFLFFDEQQHVLTYLQSLGYKNLHEAQEKLDDSASGSKIFVPLKLAQTDIDNEVQWKTVPNRLHDKRANRSLYELLTSG